MNILGNDREQKRKRIEAAVKVGGALVVGFIVAPFVFIAIKGIVGLVVAGALSMTAINLMPWFAAKLANWRLKAIKHEASVNPVETLQEQLRVEMLKLNERKTNIEKLNGQIRTFSDKVDGIKAKYGANDPSYVKLSDDLAELRKIHKHRCAKWNEAREELDRFQDAIARGNMIWEAAQAAAAARETSGLTEDEFFARLRTETAFDSIQNKYNEALASLDTAMLDEPVKAAPENVPVEPEFKTLLNKKP